MTTNSLLNRLAESAQVARLKGAPIPLDRIRDPRWILANVRADGSRDSEQTRRLAREIVERVEVSR